MVCLIRDIPIYYEEYGEGKPALCIHGYSVDHHLMTGCLEPVFAQMSGYRRIYLDLPGMGKTPAASWIQNADDMLEIIIGFIQKIVPDENMLLIGESYGGYLALGLIHNMQDRIDGLMLICPVVPAVTDRKTPERCILWKSKDFDMMADDPDVSAFLGMAVIASPENFQKYKRDVLPGIALADGDFLSRYGTGYGFTYENDLKTIEFDKPTSILTGRQDHVVGYWGAFELLNRFPRATYAVLDCAGHSLQIESEPLFALHVKDWIRIVELSENAD